MKRLAAFAALLAVVPLRAQQAPGPFTAERYFDLERVSGPRIAPDGRTIAFTRWSVNRITDRWEAAVWLMADDGRNARQFTMGRDAEWSPDGTSLAWLAEVDGRWQLLVRPLAGGETVTLTTDADSPIAFRWSPDGTRIAYTRRVAPAPLLPPPPKEGNDWAADPRLTPRARPAGGMVQLFLVPVTGGASRQLTRESFEVGTPDAGVKDAIPFDWFPDGRALVFDANPVGGDRQYLVSHLYRVDAEGGTVQRLTGVDGFWHTPVVAPDGKLIAYTGFAETTASYRTADLFVIPALGGAPRMLTAGLDRDPVAPLWDADGQTLWFTAEDHGTVNTFTADVRKGGARPASNGAHAVLLGAIARKGGYGLAVRSALTDPEEIVRFPLRKPWELQAITTVNDDLRRIVRFGEVEDLEYRSGDGLIEGWLLKPPGFSPARRYPLAVELHGGPHAMFRGGFQPAFQLLAASGSLVFLANPRGSTGSGSDVGNALGARWPDGDADDVLRGIDELVARGWVDTAKIQVGGCGAGGVLATWLIGRSSRFAAAAVRCPGLDGLALSPLPAPDEGMHLVQRPFRQDPGAWGERAPLRLVGAVRTPTLFLAGDCARDVPVDEGGEYFAALRLRGVRSTFLRFAGECGATTSRPSNWVRTWNAVMEWYR